MSETGVAAAVAAGRRPDDMSVAPATLAPEPRDRLWVFHDENCAFCRACVAWAQRRDRAGRLIAAPAQSAEARERLGPLADRALLELHAWSPEYGVSAGSDAVAAILWRLPGWWPVAALLMTPGLRAVARWGYRWVAARRGKLTGPGASCGPGA